MRTSLSLVAMLALLFGAQAFSASTMMYTLELGGDPKVADYESGLWPVYGRLPNGDQDGQQYNVGDTINWATTLAISGTYSDPGNLGDGLLPGGAANIVFDLELRQGTSPTGTLVQIGRATTDAHGNATGGGWYSLINDGDDDGDRGGFFGPDEKHNAAFPSGYNVNSAGNLGGRLIDLKASGGPNLDFYHYPAAQGWPANATAGAGKLIGMGAGYKEFKPTTNAAGVGLTTNSGSCVALGVLPICEGQISTIGLTPGVYTLWLKAGVGNNVLPGHSPSYPICTFGPPGRFALPADKTPNTVVEDSITFELIGGACEDPVITAAVSTKTHGSAGPFTIDVLSGSRIEPRVNGPTSVVVTFNKNIQQVTGTNADVTVSSGTVTNLAVAGNQLTVTMNGATNGAALIMGFPGIADAAGAACTCKQSLCIRVLIGDADASALVNVFDLFYVRDRLNTAVGAGNFRADVTADGIINVFDLFGVRDRLGTSVPACP